MILSFGCPIAIQGTVAGVPRPAIKLFYTPGAAIPY
jgi:hypothetical protein